MASIAGYEADRRLKAAVYPIPLPTARFRAQPSGTPRIIEIPDIAAPDTPEFTRSWARPRWFSTIILYVPLVADQEAIGTIIFTHR